MRVLGISGRSRQGAAAIAVDGRRDRGGHRGERGAVERAAATRTRSRLPFAAVRACLTHAALRPEDIDLVVVEGRDERDLDDTRARWSARAADPSLRGLAGQPHLAVDTLTARAAQALLVGGHAHARIAVLDLDGVTGGGIFDADGGELSPPRRDRRRPPSVERRRRGRARARGQPATSRHSSRWRNAVTPTISRHCGRPSTYRDFAVEVSAPALAATIARAAEDAPGALSDPAPIHVKVRDARTGLAASLIAPTRGNRRRHRRPRRQWRRRDRQRQRIRVGGGGERGAGPARGVPGGAGTGRVRAGAWRGDRRFEGNGREPAARPGDWPGVLGTGRQGSARRLPAGLRLRAGLRANRRARVTHAVARQAGRLVPGADGLRHPLAGRPQHPARSVEPVRAGKHQPLPPPSSRRSATPAGHALVAHRRVPGRPRVEPARPGPRQGQGGLAVEASGRSRRRRATAGSTPSSPARTASPSCSRPTRRRPGCRRWSHVDLRGIDEPTACSPRDAIRTTFSSPVDALVIERFLLMKDYWLLRSATD